MKTGKIFSHFCQFFSCYINIHTMKWMFYFIFLVYMELHQLFQKHIPQKNQLFEKFNNKKQKDISKILLHMMKNMKKNIKDKRILNTFFIELYDLLYHDILFGRIIVVKKLFKLLEELALPMKYIGEKKWLETLKKLMQLKL